MKKNQLLLLVILCFNYFSYAQDCGFDIHRDQLSKNPNYVALEKAAEERIQAVIQSGVYNRGENSTAILTIPIVVHVLHLGEAVGTGSNISAAQIQSSIDNLNSFYRGQTAGSSLDFQIEFSLAKRAPDCSATTGINRIDASGVPSYASDGVALDGPGADQDTLKNLSKWPETDYFNVWIVTENHYKGKFLCLYI